MWNGSPARHSGHLRAPGQGTPGPHRSWDKRDSHEKHHQVQRSPGHRPFQPDCL